MPTVRLRSGVLGSLLLVLVQPEVAAQSDRYFPNVHAEWSGVWPCTNPDAGPTLIFEEYGYDAEPDTVIDGLSWSGIHVGMEMGKVAVDGDRVLYRGTDGQHIEADSTLVLYDFGLAVGDTAYQDAYYNFGPTVVTAIDTVLLAARERRRFTMDNGDRWVEGIGSLSGLFRPVYMTPLGCDHPSFDFCGDYIDEDQVPYTICTVDLLGVPQEQEGRVAVHPNPSNGVFRIEGGRAHDPYLLTDASGRVIASGRLNGPMTTVGLSAVQRGVYVLRLADGAIKLVIE